MSARKCHHGENRENGDTPPGSDCSRAGYAGEARREQPGSGGASCCLLRSLRFLCGDTWLTSTISATDASRLFQVPPGAVVGRIEGDRAFEVRHGLGDAAGAGEIVP